MENINDQLTQDITSFPIQKKQQIFDYQVDYGDWIMLQKNEQYSLGLHSFNTPRIHCIAFQKQHKLLKNCYFQTRFIKTVNKNNQQHYQDITQTQATLNRPISAGTKIALLHIETNMYLCALTEQNNQISHIILKTQLCSSCIFYLQQQKNQGVTIFTNFSTVNLVHNLSKMFIKLIPSENIDNNFSASLSKSKIPLILRIVRKNDPSLEIYLNNEDLVMLNSQIETDTTALAIKQRQDFLVNSNYNLINQVSLNNEYFSLNNNYLTDIAIRQSKQNPLDFLWEIKRKCCKTTDGNFLLKKKQNVIIKHVKTGFYLCKDPIKGGLSFTKDRNNPQACFKLTNTKHYQFEKKTLNFAPIYLQDTIEIEGIGKKFMFMKKNNKSFVRMVNENLIQFFHYLFEYLDGDDSNQEQIKLMEKKYKYVYDMFSKNLQSTSDQGQYLFKISLAFLQIFNAKSQGKVIRFVLPKARLLKQLLQSLIKFLQIFINNKVYLSYDNTTKKHFISHIIGLFGKIQYLNLEPLIVNIAQTECGFCIQELTTKTKLLDLNISSRSELMIRLGTIRVINKIFSKYQLKFYYSPDCLKKICQNVSISMQKGVIIISQNKFSLQLLNETSFAQPQQYMNSRSAYFMELMKLCYYENSIRQDMLVRIIFVLREKIGQYNNILFLNTLLDIFNNFYLQRSYLPFIENITFVFIDGWLQSTTELSFILTDGGFSDFLISETLVKLTNKIQEGVWEKLKIQNRIKYLSSIVYTIGLFLSYGELNLQVFKQLQIFLIKILLVLNHHSKSDVLIQEVRFSSQLQALSQQLQEFFSLPYEQQISSQLMQTIESLIEALNISFKVVKYQKLRLLSYPLIKNGENVFSLKLFKQLYNSMRFFVFIDKNFPIIEQIAEMYQSNEQLSRNRDRLSYFWSQDRLIYHQKLVVMKEILIRMHKIKRINESLFKFDHHKKITQDLIQDIKQGVMEISSHLVDNSSKQLKSFSQLCIRGLSLPQSMYEIVFNSPNLQEQFSIQLLNFLYNYPPKFNVLLQQIHQNPVNFIKLTAKSLQLNRNQILVQDVIKLVQLSEKKLKDYQLIYFLGVLHEFWNGNYKLNIFCYEKILSLQVVYDFLQASKTLKSLKLYWSLIEKDNNYKNICDKYSMSLILIFWLSMRNPTCHRHIRNYFKWEQIFRIIQDDQVPYVVKSVFVAYLHTDTKVFKDITVFDRYLIFIKVILSQHEKYAKNLQFYDSQNFLVRGENTHVQKSQFSSLQQIARFDWKKVDYWQSLYFRPFYRQEEGIIPFLEYLITNMPTSFRAYCLQMTVTDIHSQLTAIKSLLKHQTKGNDDLIVKITKIVFLMEQNFPHIKVDKSEFPQFRICHLVIDRIVNFLFNHGRVEGFMKQFQSKNEENMAQSSRNSLEQISAVSSSLLEQSDSSHEMSRHALINPMSKTPQQYSNQKNKFYTLKLGEILQKIYKIFATKEQKARSQQYLPVLKISNKKQLISLERMMVTYYEIGGAICDILSATQDRISSLRSKAVAKRYMSRYSFQTKLEYSDDVRMYEISNVRIDSEQMSANTFIIERQNARKQGILLEEINEFPLVSCVTFSDLLYFIKKKKIMIVFNLLNTFQGQACSNFSLDEVALLFNLLLTNKQDTYEVVNETIKICQIKSIKMLLKNLIYTNSTCVIQYLGTYHCQRIIYEFFYQISLDQLRTQTVQQIIELYLLYQQSTYEFHWKIYEIVEDKFLKKMKISSRQMLSSMSKILGYFIKLKQFYSYSKNDQNSFRIEQFMLSELLKNFMINTLKLTIHESLESQNYVAQQRIKVVIQIYDFLMLLALEVPIHSIKRYLKGSLLQALIEMEINLYLRVYSQQFLIAKKYLTKQRLNSLNNIIIQSLNIFHNIKFLSNPAVQGLSILKQQRINLLNLQDQKYEKFKSKLQLLNWTQAYRFYENKFYFIIIVKQNKQIVSVFPKQENVSGKWKLLLLDQMNKQKSLTAKKQFVFKITQFVMNKQAENKQEVLASFLEEIKRVILAISIILISILTLLCFLFNGMQDNPFYALKIVLLSLNIPFILFLILQKIVYFITVSKMTFLTNHTSTKQSYTTDSKLSLFFNISQNFTGILMGITLLALNIGSYLYSEIIPTLYLVIPFYSWRNSSYFLQLAIKRGNAILQFSVIFFFFLLLFELIGRISSYESMAQVNFHPFYNTQKNQIYYNNYLSLIFAEWKQKYVGYPQTIIFTFIVGFFYLYIIGFMVFHSIDYEGKSSQQHSECYLCPDKVSVVKVDFLKHIEYEHNVFKYAFFFKYILKKKQKQLTSTEKNIRNLIEIRNHHIFLR